MSVGDHPARDASGADIAIVARRVASASITICSSHAIVAGRGSTGSDRARADRAGPAGTAGACTSRVPGDGCWNARPTAFSGASTTRGRCGPRRLRTGSTWIPPRSAARSQLWNTRRCWPGARSARRRACRLQLTVHGRDALESTRELRRRLVRELPTSCPVRDQVLFADLLERFLPGIEPVAMTTGSAARPRQHGTAASARRPPRTE